MAKEFEADVDESGRLIFPAERVKKYGLSPGTKIRLEDNAHGMHQRRLLVGSRNHPMPISVMKGF
jgi:bifunctional DNA-binding transcriptional regulator/antitoxin component of YhaV-PrlF toxin-antitoxin module